MLIEYVNLICYHSFVDDFLEMVDLVDERGYSPDSETKHGLNEQLNSLRSGKFDKNKQFKITFDTENKTFSFTGKTLPMGKWFNNIAYQHTNRNMKLLREEL